MNKRATICHHDTLFLNTLAHTTASDNTSIIRSPYQRQLVAL